jgi:hypothetical protein
MDRSKRQKTEITIETHSVSIIRMQRGKLTSVFCERCCRDVRIFTLANAALIFHANVGFLETLLHGNQIHDLGEKAICGNTLAEYFKQEIRFVED